MSNFTFLPADYRTLAVAAQTAESHVFSDARGACFHARFALETAVHWLYRHDQGLEMPYDQSLGALLHAPSFQQRVPEAIFQKARTIQKVGNLAVHSQKPIRQFDALQLVKELQHILYWLARTYTHPGAASMGTVEWDGKKVPRPDIVPAPVPQPELERLEKELESSKQQELKRQQEVDALDEDLKILKLQLAEARAANEEAPDTHDYSEAETRTYLIDVDLQRAGWPLDQKRDREYEVTGMPNKKGLGYVDYVLWGDDGKPLAVVEAKRTTADPKVGQQQAKLYADCLEAMHGQRPIIFYTNGYETTIWDDATYPPRRVAGFYKKDELTRLILRRSTLKPLNIADISTTIVERYYQRRAIGSICSNLAAHQRKGLLVMATGTGKTRMAIALVDLLQRANWAKRVLFLADRVSLVNQAANAFKIHLPDSSPVNLVTEKDTEGRVYVSTYPTMMGLINETKGNAARFGVGHFDLIIIDEAHRSVYQKYSEIFNYFDSLLFGLTATPREQVDRNTYELFDLEPGVPTDAYELETAVRDEFLVPPRVQEVDLKFPRDGINYDDLSDEEKLEWESKDWGDDEDGDSVPDRVNASAINNWLFNISTVDLVLKHLMEHGHKVEGGDRLGKTILFARNHDHAAFIEERFNYHYPQFAGHFARVIDHQAKYPQSLIDDFSQKDKAPHIAISVDMLDTGIDVPEVLNLVFFKPVYSRIKFWQMIGRGTRLCPELFGPDDAKKDFRIFDFCFNFAFFKENPNGIEGAGGVPLGTRIFRSRVQLLGHLQTSPELDKEGALAGSLGNTLHGEVAAMNHENFIVRMYLGSVERFQDRAKWNALTEEDRATLQSEVAGLPNQLDTDEIEARMFDMTALRMQLAHVEGDTNTFETRRGRVVEISMLLEEKDTIPAVKAQLEYLAAIQEISFWEDINLTLLEELRIRLRGLVQFLDKKKRKIVYTDFQDEIIDVNEVNPLTVPKMTGPQYAKKVEEYLKSHLDHIAVQKLRQNEPLTPTDIEELENVLVQIGEDEGDTLLTGLLESSEAPSLAHFVRKLVGMDRGTAIKAFAAFMTDKSLSTQQTRFIELIIEQLTAQGIMPPEALYEPPFTNLNVGGPDAVFKGKGNLIDGLFTALEQTQRTLREAN
jgi:type I restriction enzyme R subunit